MSGHARGAGVRDWGVRGGGGGQRHASGGGRGREGTGAREGVCKGAPVGGGGAQRGCQWGGGGGDAQVGGGGARVVVVGGGVGCARAHGAPRVGPYLT